MKKQEYIVLLSMLAFLMLLGYLFAWQWVGYVVFGLAILALLLPSLARYIIIAWIQFFKAIGWINQRVILGLVFFLFLTPIALLARAFGKRFLILKKQKDSYYYTREHTFVPDDLKETF